MPTGHSRPTILPLPFTRRRGVLFFAAAMLAFSAPVFGGTDTYIGPNGGDWNTAAYWSPTGVPAPGDDAVFAPAGAGSYEFDFSYYGAGSLNSLTLGDGASSTPTLTQGSPSLSLVANSLRLDSGTLVESGDADSIAFETILDVAPVSGGAATLSLSNQANLGQSFEATAYIGHGGSGTMLLGNAYANMQDLYIGYGSDGYVSNEGQFSASTIYVGNGAGGSGTLMQSGNSSPSTYIETGMATLEVAVGAQSTGFVENTANASGGGLNVIEAEIGDGGGGTFVQSGASQSLFGTLYVGNLSAGTALISNGSLNAGTLYVGSANGGASGVGTVSMTGGSGSIGLAQIGAGETGTFSQSGGSVMFGTLSIGSGAGSSGTMSLSGGTLMVSPSWIVGDGGSGTFLQSGGLATNDGKNPDMLTIGDSGTGYVLLSAGTLNGDSEDVGFSEGTTLIGAGTNGVGTFVQTGGFSDLGWVGVGSSAGSTGTILLSGGTLETSILEVGGLGAGTFLQSGSQTSSSTYFLSVVSSSGTGAYFSIAGGTFTVLAHNGSEIEGGTFAQSGGYSNVGTVELGFDADPGTMTLSGGTFIATKTNVGSFSGNGTFLQSGSQTFSSLGQLVVADGTSGYLSMTGGTLTADRTTLGVEVDNRYLGLASMVQSGGFSSLGILEIQGGSTLTINAGTVQAQQIIAAGEIAINGGTLQLVGPIPGGSIIGPTNLTIATGSGGGRFDITNHAFILPYVGTSPIGELTPTRHTQTYPANSIQRYLQTAIDGGAWDGPGITSSTAENDITGTTAVGAVDNADLLALQGNNYTGQTWLGQSITSDNTVLVRFTYYGDTNLDGIVNGIDVDNLIQGYEGFGDGWLYGDFNYDGIVDSLDVTEMIIGYTGQGKPLGDAISPGQAQFLLSLATGLSAAQIAKFDQIVGVPEPATLTLAAASLAILRRRRCRLLA